jgi:hypothetical protein
LLLLLVLLLLLLLLLLLRNSRKTDALPAASPLSSNFRLKPPEAAFAPLRNVGHVHAYWLCKSTRGRDWVALGSA